MRFRLVSHHEDYLAAKFIAFMVLAFIAEQVWPERLFENMEKLHKKMVAIVEQMSLSQPLDLIKAHPELGSKKRIADASVQEQASVGLNQISSIERQQIDRLNSQYREKFGFPFVMVVKGQTLNQVMIELSNRLQNPEDPEIKRAILEISKITRFRLKELTSSRREKTDRWKGSYLSTLSR